MTIIERKLTCLIFPGHCCSAYCLNCCAVCWLRAARICFLQTSYKINEKFYQYKYKVRQDDTVRQIVFIQLGEIVVNISKTENWVVRQHKVTWWQLHKCISISKSNICQTNLHIDTNFYPVSLIMKWQYKQEPWKR